MQNTRQQANNQQIVFVSALELLSNKNSGHSLLSQDCRGSISDTSILDPPTTLEKNVVDRPAISDLCFPFNLKADQIAAVEAWENNQRRGSVIYGSGTGKTEIAFECARRAAQYALKIENRKYKQFRILLLVPRIVLVEQNYERLRKYGIDPERIGKYFGEEKQIREITISTYQSLLLKPRVIENTDMIILDEMHLARRAFAKIFPLICQLPQILLLGLTATIDEADSKYDMILSIMPAVRKYLIKDAVIDRRLAKPVIFPVRVSLTDKEQTLYDSYSSKIRSISNRFKRYDANAMMQLMKEQGFPRWQARAWFLNVKKRKHLLAASQNKMMAALELICKKHQMQKVMVFSETLESVRNLKQLLKSRGVPCSIIDSRTQPFRRKTILSKWGTDFHVLLSVHTLEIGYDVPEAGVEIILATTSNMNQIVQRVGRVLRKVEGKDSALVYLIYVSDTKDDKMLDLVKVAVETNGGSM